MVDSLSGVLTTDLRLENSEFFLSLIELEAVVYMLQLSPWLNQVT